MRWMTRTWCTGPEKPVEAALALGAPHPPAQVDRPVYAHYLVVGATDEDFTLLETKFARKRGHAYSDPRSGYRKIYYRFRRRAFGVWQWWHDSWDPTDRPWAYEYNGGPCLNVDARINQCPFAMPALSLREADESSWIAKQTVREQPWGMEFLYPKPDGSTLTIRWRRGEPWPEASPSCTALLRDKEDGRVRFTRSAYEHEDDYRLTEAYAEDLAIERERER